MKQSPLTHCHPESNSQIKRIRGILVILLFFLVFPVFPQDENYDAIYLRLRKEYTLNADGSMDYRYIKEQKLQTYRAFHSLYGETFIVYNPKTQKLKISDVHTVMADGKKVPAPGNAFNEVLPGFCANAPAYNHLREMVITHPGLERNAVIHLDYTLHTNNGYYSALMGNELLAEYEPVKELTVIVRHPLSSVLSYKILNTPVEPVITTENGFRVYTWKWKDVPAISQEEFQKSGYELYPRLIFSTSGNREKIYQEFMNQPAFSFEANDDMVKAVASILAENKENTDIILRLQEKVVNELRLWPVPLRHTGFTCRNASETWNSNGGTPAEKAILLTALLKTANIPANLVLVTRNPYYDKNIGTLMDVDDILVMTEPRETGLLYLSASTQNPQNLVYGLSGKTLVWLDPGEKPGIRVAREFAGRLSVNGTFEIDEKKQLTGDIAATFAFNNNPWLLLQRDKNKVKSYFSGGLGSSELKELKIANIGQEETFVSYSVRKENPFGKDTNYYTFSLPYLNNGIESWGMKLLPKARAMPVDIPSEMEETYEYDLQVKQGLKLFSPDDRTEIKNNTGSFLFEIRKSGDKITVKKSIKLYRRGIEAEDYPGFKAIMDHWNSDRFRKIVFYE